MDDFDKSFNSVARLAKAGFVVALVINLTILSAVLWGGYTLITWLVSK